MCVLQFQQLVIVNFLGKSYQGVLHNVEKAPQRVSFIDKKEIIDLPNLIEIQIKSYNQFLQTNKFPEERENIGLQEVFNEMFPIKSYDEKTILGISLL